MEIEFISLIKLGVGPVLVRYSEITLVEPSPLGYTKIYLSSGGDLIIEEDFLCVLNKINLSKLNNKQNNNT